MKKQFKKGRILAAGFLLALGFCFTCQGPAPEKKGMAVSGPVQFDPNKAPYPKLSDYGFFTGIQRDLQPNTGVLPYELITPLFTDYAHKARFVWLPKGTQATVATDGRLDFPGSGRFDQKLLLSRRLCQTRSGLGCSGNPLVDEDQG